MTINSRYFFIKSNSSYHKIEFSEILYFKSLGNYINLIRRNGTTEIIYGTMYELIDKLPMNFLRIHKSYIINIDHVDKITENELIFGKIKIPYSPSYKKCLNSHIKKLML